MKVKAQDLRAGQVLEIENYGRMGNNLSMVVTKILVEPKEWNKERVVIYGKCIGYREFDVDISANLDEEYEVVGETECVA